MSHSLRTGGRSRPRPGFLALLGSLLLHFLPVGLAAEPVPIDQRPASMDRYLPWAGQEGRVGSLDFIAGLSLRSPDRRFGGWSDLWVSPDGRRLLALSDHGSILGADLDVAPDGGILGLRSSELRPLLDAGGRPLDGLLSDSESMVALPEGLVVGFERLHRLLLYPGPWPLLALPVELPQPPGLAGAPVNGGLEALVGLADGRLVLFSEGLPSGAGRAAWVEDGSGAYLPFTYLPARGFSPTGATLLPSGDLLVLERRLSFLRGWEARVCRLRAAELREGSRLAGEELAYFGFPLASANFEGIAAIQAPDGEGVLVYLVSDDNFFRFARTQLLQFRLRGP